ncbi:MAG TPA: hypothetical protein VMW25_00760 [Clostridia bacterium]|nr:hypothetical protein [Clostridia bacterium]
MRKLVKKHLPLLIFLISLSSFTFLFFIQRNFMTNIDERDQIVNAFLMANGLKVYKDFFTTHFPLPYYWVYIFTPFWTNSPPHRVISILRLSIVILYYLSFLAVFFVSRSRKTKTALCLWIISLSTFASLYHGNLLLSETFVAIFISSLFWLILPLVFAWEKINFVKSVLIFLFVSLAFWTQPLLAPLFLIPLLLIPGKILKKIFPSFFILNLLPLALFHLSGQLQGFWENAVWFNFRVYSSFFPERIGHYSMLQQNFISFFQNEISFLEPFSGFIGSWQFVIHAAVLGLLIWTIGKRNWRLSISFLLLFYGVRAREIKIIPGKIFNFGIYPLALLGSASFIALITFIFPKKKIISLLALGLLFGLSIKESLPIINQSLKPGYNYHVFWSWRQEIGETINNLTQPEEKILIYPHDVDLYFFANRKPIDRFTYWFPWLDSVKRYHDERETSLKTAPPPVIYIGNFTYKNNPHLYAQFFPDLLNGYSQIAKNGQPTNIWLRDDLNQRLKAPYSLFTTNKQ